MSVKKEEKTNTVKPVWATEGRAYYTTDTKFMVQENEHDSRGIAARSMNVEQQLLVGVRV